MPSVHSLPLAEIVDLLLRLGYRLVEQDERESCYDHEDEGRLPITIPHTIDPLPLDVANSVARKIGMNDYLKALAEYLGD